MLPIYEMAGVPNYPRNMFLGPQADAGDASQWRGGSYGDACEGLVQPTVVRPKAGSPRLLVWFRDRRNQSIYSARSEDDGRSWTACAPTALPNPNSGIQAWALRSGRIALAYNPTTVSIAPPDLGSRLAPPSPPRPQCRTGAPPAGGA